MINDIVLEARPGGISRPNLYCLVLGTHGVGLEGPGLVLHSCTDNFLASHST